MNPRPLLLGHRGARGRKYGVPDNTVAAFDLALEHGCDGIEFDVRLTSDGCALLCHDRMFRSLRLSANPAARFKELPHLEEILARYSSRAFLDIELKVPGLESRLLTALRHDPPACGYVVSSFLPQVLVSLRAHMKSVPLGIICKTRRQLSRWPHLPVDYVIVHKTLIAPKLASEIRAAGKQLFVWTVNRRETIGRLAQWGVDGIISDKPDVVAAALRNSHN
ncbi:MAG: glycerophosphodiester phosphodiesterase [Acidobacteria bacterium]|nr:glycerophosphodiester phosphodiesterase [Acidobacteriota bacterium]